MSSEFEDVLQSSQNNGKVYFFSEQTDFVLSEEAEAIKWVNLIAEQANHKINGLNYIFCNDVYLHQINVEYLDHDTYTDIITFDNSEEEQLIEGDIFISIDRIRENAATYNASFDVELHRVMAHGLLHLLGFGDKTDDEKLIMRTQEDKALTLWSTTL
ncbi:rRNA maturation RNase YbeY [uncultured Microscilla sp.]|uniref:rRNA maturation RNase YbeY n=1 Tax=uncultured Microscilla sp. TaxID=432653 RepID=UPI00262E57DD|nr:rRNA maturation RNase YbeY [uncultured Microscilla sp.]